MKLTGCARCGEDHDDIEFRPLTRPIMSGERGEGAEVEWTSWAPCPTNGEPILMRSLPKPAPQVFACKR